MELTKKQLSWCKWIEFLGIASRSEAEQSYLYFSSDIWEDYNNKAIDIVKTIQINDINTFNELRSFGWPVTFMAF